MVKRHGDPDVKAAAYKCQAERFTSFSSNLYTESTAYAFAGFIDYVCVLHVLEKGTAPALIVSRFGSILPGILP